MMRIYGTEAALKYDCPSCRTRAGVWCGGGINGPMNCERRERLADLDKPGAAVNYIRERTDLNFEYVSLPLPPHSTKPPKYFFADTRARWEGDFEPLEEPYVLIHEGTSSIASLMGTFMWASRWRDHPWQHYFVFRARNKSQCIAWLLDNGFPTHNQAGRTVNPHNLNMGHTTLERITVDTTNREIAALMRAQDNAQARIDYLLSLPAEPEFEDDFPVVIYFEKEFANARVYTYAAVKADNDQWYTTGPKAGHVSRTWEDLIAWINDGDTVDVWVATQWTEI